MTKKAMKSVLKLNNPLWKTPERRAILDKAVQPSGAELESLIKQKVLNSKPAGKTYRRGKIKRGRVVTGSRFHRASAKGQPFANLTGATLNATRSKRIGLMRNTVSNQTKQAKILDDKNKLNRPFFQSTAEEFKPKFKQNLQEAIAEIL